MLGACVESGLFCAAPEPRLEFSPEGGGDFILGDNGHCGVDSADATALLGPRAILDAASGAVMPGCCSCGTLDAERARCMAAAEG